MTYRHLPPAGTRVRLSDYRNWLAPGRRLNRRAAALSEELRKRFFMKHSFVLSSGRTALWLSLGAMRRLGGPRRNQVVVPSYTCYSVPACVIKAGLKVRVADIDPSTLSIDTDLLARQDLSGVLAIVATSLYGYPDNLPRLEEIARTAGAYLVDDAAQSMGAQILGRDLGTFGDCGVFSFDKGKPVTSIQGGAIVTNDSGLATEIESDWRGLPQAPVARRIRLASEMLAYGLLLQPTLYGLPASMPFLKLGQTPYSQHFPSHRYPDFQAGIAKALLARLEQIVAARRRNARLLMAAIESCSNISIIRANENADPGYLRLPVLFQHASNRDAALARLARHRLGASPSYPDSIVDVAQVRPFFVGNPQGGAGRDVARRILTLPTHGYLQDRDIERISEILHTGDFRHATQTL